MPISALRIPEKNSSAHLVQASSIEQASSWLIRLRSRPGKPTLGAPGHPRNLTQLTAKKAELKAALLRAHGRVDIAWTLDPKTPRLHLKWTEKNGPAVRAPDKRSFGTRLIETLGKQFKGDVQLTYEPSGFVYAFDVPLASLASIASE